MGLFPEMTLLAQDMPPSHIIFGSFKHYQCALQSFSFIIHQLSHHYSLIHIDIRLHSGCEVEVGLKTPGQEQGPVWSLLGQIPFWTAVIVFLQCVRFNCWSLSIRLNWWELVWGEPFAFSWIKKKNQLSIINNLFCLANHTGNAVYKVLVLTARFCPG